MHNRIAMITFATRKPKSPPCFRQKVQLSPHSTKERMAKLSVNINKVATLRNARGGDNPDVLQAALDCELYGAQGITVHPRPDERHIRRSDVFELAQTIRTELNIEGYPSEEFMDMVCRVRPTQVTLVPDSPEQLTSTPDGTRNETNIFSLKSCRN